MQLRPRGGPPKRFGNLAEYPATPWLEKSQGPAPQPPSTSRPRRTGQPRRARGRSPPARSQFAAPITQDAAAELPNHTGAAAPAGPALTPPPFHCTRLPCGAITPRGGSARGNSAASPCMRPCGGWKGQGLRRTARAPPARAATSRPAQVRARIAGADCERSHPRLRSEPERAAQTRRRGAGDSESANRRAAPKGTAPKGAACPPRLRAAARGGSGARISRHGSPPPHPAGSDVRSRPPKRAEHDSRPPSPAPPIRFTAD